MKKKNKFLCFGFLITITLLLVSSIDNINIIQDVQAEEYHCVMSGDVGPYSGWENNGTFDCKYRPTKQDPWEDEDTVGDCERAAASCTITGQYCKKSGDSGGLCNGKYYSSPY